MTRRIQPPPHPTTGHPFVDNSIRDSWREYRALFNGVSPLERYYAISRGMFPNNELPRFTPTSLPFERIPRKMKKKLVKGTLRAAFTYHDPTYYTPKRALL